MSRALGSREDGYQDCLERQGFSGRGKLNWVLKVNLFTPWSRGKGGHCIPSRGNSMHKGRKEDSILGERRFPKYGWSLGCLVGSSPRGD